MHWLILTGEYPPAAGGVSDYSQQVAEGLAARGEEVTVYTPERAGRDANKPERGKVHVEGLPGHFGWKGLRRLRACLNRQPPGGRILIQYVPHAFGWKAMNVPLCVWLAAQRRHALWIMFHEVAYPFHRSQSWRHNLLARVNEWMARRLVQRAERVLVSTTAWLPRLENICPRMVAAELAAVPSNFETLKSGKPPPSLDLPGKGDGPVLGHFGTFSTGVRQRLAVLVPAILARCPEATFFMLGRGSAAFADQMKNNNPYLGNRIVGAGELPRETVPVAIAACDLMIQPYADGINTRRTSTMCSLALSRPVVTQTGANSEPIWQESHGVHLVEGKNPESWAAAVRHLLDAPNERRDLSARGATLYRTHFSLEKTLDLLRSPAASREPSPR